MSNSVTLVGNLVEDPELRFTANGVAMARIRRCPFSTARRMRAARVATTSAPVAPTSVAVAADTMVAPITTPSSAFLAAHTGGMVSLSRPL